MGVCNCSMFCCTLLYVHSSIAIILMGKRELVALLYLSSWCLVMVERLFLAVPRGCLRFVIVVFPDHINKILRISKLVSDYLAWLAISNTLVKQPISLLDTSLLALQHNVFTILPSIYLVFISRIESFCPSYRILQSCTIKSV